MTGLIDTHAHINYEPLVNDVDNVVARALKNGVERIICVGTDLNSSRKALELTEKYSCVYAAAGVHPHDCLNLPDDWLAELEYLLSMPRVVAVGEIGLDYYRDYTPGEIQRTVFSAQVSLAKEINKPMIIHNRRADQDVATILAESNNYHGVLHCFSSHLEYAEMMINRGLMLSFTGNITYRSRKLTRVLQNIPVDRIMAETDCPFILPAPLKQKPNEPAYLPYIVGAIADIRGIDPEEAAELTTFNAMRFFFSAEE